MDAIARHLDPTLFGHPSVQKGEEDIPMKRLTGVLGRLVLLSALAIPFVTACSGGGGGPELAPQVGAACLGCHGNKDLAMTVVLADPTSETVPLYVDIAAYSATKHGNVECVMCHVGMNLTPPHNAPRTYGSWSQFSAADPDVTRTRNYFVVPAAACLNCHATARYKAFVLSDHATDKDRGFNFDGTPRVGTPITVDGTPYQINETYNATDCGACHVSTNCGTCHWKSKVMQQAEGNATSLWTDYSDASFNTKTAMTTKWLDWTVNIASHDFNGKKSLTTSNDVCSACHAGFYDPPGSGDVPALGISGRTIEAHPQVEELLLSASRGIHTTKQFCPDCHLNVHLSRGIETASNGWAFGTTQCASCHPDNILTGTHADVTCIGCHDAELTVMRDLTTHMVVPKTVDVNLEKSWPSHNLIKGADVQCDKCHFPGNTIGAPESVPTVQIH